MRRTLVSWKISAYSPPTRPVMLPPSGRSWMSAWLAGIEPHRLALLMPDHCTRCGVVPILLNPSARSLEPS